METPKQKYWDINQESFEAIRLEIKKRINGRTKEERIEIFNQCLFSLWESQLEYMEDQIEKSKEPLRELIGTLCTRLNYLTLKTMDLKEKLK
jgi:hypothetical protein